MTTTSSFDAIVIGGGANGLVAATALGKAGRSVLLLERADAPGGMGRTIEIAPGFRVAPLDIDAGWIPPAVRDGLGLGGLEPVPHEIPLTVAAGPGEFLPVPRSPELAAAAIRRCSVRDADRWGAFVALVADLHGFLARLYERPAPDIGARGPRELLALAALGRRARGLGRRRMIDLLRILPMPVEELLDEWFETEALKAAIASGGVQGIRQGPRSGGTAFVLLHHLVGAPSGTMRGRGSWPGGPEDLQVALWAAARARGVTIRTGAEVERILVRDDRVVGVALTSGEELDAPVVLSSADPARTLLDLVDPVWLDPELLLAVRNIRFRGVESRVLFALDGLPGFPGLPHPEQALTGVVTLTPTLAGMERAYDAAKYGLVAEQPHVEVSVPTIASPALAPAGKHVLVARVQWTPYALRGGETWDEPRAATLGDQVQRAIAAVALGFGDRVLRRVVLTPKDLEERYGLTEGAPSHGELGLDQILFMRPVAGCGRYATPIDGLYLCGAGTHPGPGIPGGPGWLAARRALRDGPRLGRRRSGP
ncbi:MAG: phytoene desaturase family protein [Gemmatimonadales bacterium]